MVFRDKGTVMNAYLELINVHNMLHILLSVRYTFLTNLYKVYLQAMKLLFQKEGNLEHWSPGQDIF
jgi:hypothetical protein